ncbi:CPBP family intramembrane glutamic endopeptidase [Gloeothece citriformis]|uniref:CPBP family intramembrane glutamic endopeptidase n=1 Tax=Gloeothece citriformis TaxID=2546356 RepID=UPI001EF02D1F|nr:CPBP family intramembrane glutamic endopeptidase [Gloeothece citriformis]
MLIADSHFLLNLGDSHNCWLKIAIFLGTWFIVWLPVAIPLAWGLQWNPFQSLAVTETQKLPLIISLYLLAPFIVGKAAQIEGESWANYGLVFNSALLVELLWGIVLAVSTIGVIFASEGLLGWIQWHWENYRPFWRVAFPILGLALTIGGIEELIFRGLFLNVLEQNYSLWVAGAISSGIFALLHLIWERKNTLPQLPGLWLMGMVLVAARIVTGGSLGLAWGLHTGWVWAIATLDSAKLISYTGKGSRWITGIGGQPLAGVAGIVGMVITAIMLWVFFPK